MVMKVKSFWKTLVVFAAFSPMWLTALPAEDLNQRFAARGQNYQADVQLMHEYIQRADSGEFSPSDEAFLRGQAGQLALVAGSMIDGVPTDVKKDIFQACIASTDKLHHDFGIYHFYSLCCRANLGQVMDLGTRKKMAESIREEHIPAALEHAEMEAPALVGGVYRVLAGIYSSPLAVMVGLWLPSDAANFGQMALEMGPMPFEPFGVYSGPEVIENVYYGARGFAAHASAVGSSDERKQLMARSLEVMAEVLNMPPRAGDPRAFENGYYRRELKKFYDKVEGCQRSIAPGVCLKKALW